MKRLSETAKANREGVTRRAPRAELSRELSAVA
jgi:hypothetical protein